MDEKIEKLAADIYAKLAVSEFYKTRGLSYEEMEFKAREAAASFYKKQ